MKRILLLVGAVGAGVAAYLFLRPPRAGRMTAIDAGGDAVTDPIPTMPVIRRPLGSRSGSGGSGGRGGTIATEPDRPPSLTFEQEVRDTGWANEQEKEMTLRLRRIVDELAAHGTPVDIDSIECRRSQCRLGLHARDAAALGKLYAALETPEGLYGWADNLLLEPVDTAPDGQVTTHVVAAFDRD